MKDTIKAILYSWLEKKLPEVLPRDLDIERYIDIKPRKIVVITGFRRTGKTYLLYYIIKHLLKKYTKEDILYINFDDERIPERSEFLTHIFPAVKEVFPRMPRYVFLDEVQNMPEWSRWVRRIYDNEDVHIFITGSSSKVSSREIPSQLRGRCVEIPLYPLSFREFLRFRGMEIDLGMVPYAENETAKLMRVLREYMVYGGMPEIAFTDDESMKIEILQQYYATVVARDIVERYHIKNDSGLRAMVRILLNSTYYSISKVHNTMKSMGYKIGKTTLLNYLNYVETTYFLRSVSIFSHKVKDQLQYPRKIYFIDNGFITALSTRFSNNYGRLMENLVAVELMRRNGPERIYYWKDQRGREVDFIVVDGMKIKELIQVCYDVEDINTRRREIRALEKAGEEMKCKNKTVITWDYEEEGEIKFIPLWKWLLERGE